MFFSMPIQWYHSHVYAIWPDGTFKAQNISALPAAGTVP